MKNDEASESPGAFLFSEPSTMPIFGLFQKCRFGHLLQRVLKIDFSEAG